MQRLRVDVSERVVCLFDNFHYEGVDNYHDGDGDTGEINYDFMFIIKT